ncbi:protein max isoform X2 [Danaus plexippus]|uniref:protein max isoform X2 n=1 Tax=Danaus plexippus TaxID=13037 RepID=UPI0013C49981|nr:protein max isoform X2 [Danaus plexippus]
MMSDDDRDIDIESDAEKRAHHNALERKRRDHIKDSFTSLRDSVPALQGEKVASRAQILKKAAEYIQFMRRKNNAHQQDIDDLKRQNNILETQIRALEKARATGNYMDAHELGLGIKSAEDSSHDTDSSDGEGTTRRVKKLKINSVNV